MTTSESNKIIDRANQIVSFTFKNKFETEAAWLNKTIKSFLNAYGRQDPHEDSILVYVWCSLLEALRMVEDVRLENKINYKRINTK
jgi:hypothetical protein